MRNDQIYQTRDGRKKNRRQDQKREEKDNRPIRYTESTAVRKWWCISLKQKESASQG